MAIVKQLDKRSGITYVYESKSVWDVYCHRKVNSFATEK